MKRFLLGAVLGIAATTAMCSCGNKKCMRRAKRMLVDKFEDVFG